MSVTCNIYNNREQKLPRVWLSACWCHRQCLHLGGWCHSRDDIDALGHHSARKLWTLRRGEHLLLDRHAQPMERLSGVGIAARGVAQHHELVVHDGREDGGQAGHDREHNRRHQRDLGQRHRQQHLALI